MIYLEHTGREHYFDDPDDMALYASLFDHIRAAAMKPDDSLKLIYGRAEELEDQ
jgi:hypothetical protein